MRRIPYSLAVAVAVAVLAIAAPRAGIQDSCIYEFTNNSATPESDLDVTCSTLADNKPDETPMGNDVGIGANACSSMNCNDDQACLCDDDGNDPSDFEHFFEFVVQCRGAQEDCSLQVDLDRLQIDALVPPDRGGTIHLYKNTEGFVGWEEVAQIPVTNTTVGTKTVFFTDEPACKVAFRLAARDEVTEPMNDAFQAKIDNLRVFGDCVEPQPGFGDVVPKCTASLRAAIGQNVQSAATNLTGYSITIDRKTMFKKNTGAPRPPSPT
jgi:hypothetical protein